MSVFITRKFVIPAIPEYFSIGSFGFRFSILTMVLFAMLMLFTSINMIRSRDLKLAMDQHSTNKLVLLLYGIAIGLVTGFLGAGGGFLLVPVLVLVLKLPMKKAVGTSLLIIALNSLIGFASDAGHFHTNWFLLICISALAMIGVLLGSILGKRIEGAYLRKGFGWFILLMGIYILVKELFFYR